MLPLIVLAEMYFSNLYTRMSENEKRYLVFVWKIFVMAELEYGSWTYPNEVNYN